MKKLFYGLMIVIGVISIFSFADNKKAKFKFEYETFNFGKIPQGVPVDAEFPFTNMGDEPLIITAASATCGCTKPIYPDTPVLKGGSGVIKVSYNAKAKGVFNKTITLMSNSDSPTKFLYIKGEVIE